ncbi:MAG: hypothetical protein FIB08_08105 [Candidatus Methanoperedens sp.]|nr:hypothetical protein [Candidatus Methanoperedens sp.]
MQIWEERPITTANLLNPAFCGEIIRRCAKSYSDEIHKPFPFVLTFILLPIVLHKATRESLPRSIRKSLHAWLEENPSVKIGFAARCQQMIPFTKEALAFLLKHKAIKFDEKGNILISSFRKKGMNCIEGGEINECFNKSEFTGKWFAKSGTSYTIYSFWGIKP